MLRNAAVVLSVVSALVIGHRAAAAEDCFSGPGNGNAESGDCLNDVEIELGPKGDLLFAMVFTTIPALAFDFNAMGHGVRGVSKGMKIAGIIGGALTLAATAGYVSVAGAGSDDGLAVGVAGMAIGAPALIGGIVGLALGNPTDDREGPLTGFVRCSEPGCRVSMPKPSVRRQAGATSVVVPLVDGRW